MDLWTALTSHRCDVWGKVKVDKMENPTNVMKHLSQLKHTSNEFFIHFRKTTAVETL